MEIVACGGSKDKYEERSEFVMPDDAEPVGKSFAKPRTSIPAE
jgi:hypothetical protein